MIYFTAPRHLERGHAYPQSGGGAFYLTTASNRVQTNRAVAKSTAGKLTARSKAAISRERSVWRLFLFGLSFMGGLDRELQSSPVRFPGLSTCPVPPTRLTAGVRYTNLNEGDHVMTTIPRYPVPTLTQSQQNQIRNAINTTVKYFKRDVLGAGHPWTPAIKARITRELNKQGAVK